LAQAARAQQAAQAAARQQAQQQAAMALNEGGHESSDSAPEGPQNAKFGVIVVNRDEATNWGKLRNKSAEDLTRGKSEAVSEEYRKSVETYFKVLGERAKK
jgi:type II secretory pathway pseudopilin PulG